VQLRLSQTTLVANVLLALADDTEQPLLEEAIPRRICGQTGASPYCRLRQMGRQNTGVSWDGGSCEEALICSSVSEDNAPISLHVCLTLQYL